MTISLFTVHFTHVSSYSYQGMLYFSRGGPKLPRSGFLWRVGECCFCTVVRTGVGGGFDLCCPARDSGHDGDDNSARGGIRSL